MQTPVRMHKERGSGLSVILVMIIDDDRWTCHDRRRNVGTTTLDRSILITLSLYLWLYHSIYLSIDHSIYLSITRSIYIYIYRSISDLIDRSTCTIHIVHACMLPSHVRWKCAVLSLSRSQTCRRSTSVRLTSSLTSRRTTSGTVRIIVSVPCRPTKRKWRSKRGP